MAQTARMAFERYGHGYHLRIDSAEALQAAAELDEAHWVANNAPLNTVHGDAVFLEMLDADGNGRITCREMKAAIRWLLEVLRDWTGITAGSDVLSLAAINLDTPQGRQIAEAAEKVAARVGGKPAEQVTLDHVRQVKAEVLARPVSAAGVVLPEAADDAETTVFLRDIIATVGGTAHPKGGVGVGEEKLAAFLAAAQGYLAWREQGEIPAGQETTAIMPLGTNTAGTYAILTGLRGKLDQYFAQCQALLIDERFVQRMGWTEDELDELDFDDPTVLEEVLQKAPIAKAQAGAGLDLSGQVNPYYVQMLSAFQRQVMPAVLGDDTDALTGEDWQKIKAFFAGYTAWLAAEVGAEVAPLGPETLQQYLQPRFADAVRALIEHRRRTAFVLDNVQLVEKAALWQRDMITFANSFISFPHLYDPKRRALFERGSLVIDGRWFNMAVLVGDRKQHCAVAKTSNMFVLYVQVLGKDGAVVYEVAAPVTAGGKGSLCVNKRGVFYDGQGREWDARVVDIVENPISFREALVSPFRRLGRLLTGKIESLTAAAEKTLDAQATAALSLAGPKPTPQRGPGLAAGGLVVGAGVALAALGSAAAYVAKTLTTVSPLALIGGVVGALLLVMAPMAVIAFLKLRKRDLRVILEGSGWGINAPMRLTHRQARFFTRRPRYPQGVRGVWRWGWIVAVAVVILVGLATVGYVLSRDDGPAPAATEAVQQVEQPVEPPVEGAENP